MNRAHVACVPRMVHFQSFLRLRLCVFPVLQLALRTCVRAVAVVDNYMSVYDGMLSTSAPPRLLDPNAEPLMIAVSTLTSRALLETWHMYLRYPVLCHRKQLTLRMHQMSEPTCTHFTAGCTLTPLMIQHADP